jgi:hypothetical protein
MLKSNVIAVSTLALVVLLPADSRAQMITPAPVDVTALYVPSGFMGDGEQGGLVQVRPVTGEKPRPGAEGRPCYKVTYKPGNKAWAGVYWLYPPDNWGDKPGRSIRGARRITFWAVGAKGGEIVEFKAGGVTGKRYNDSFEVGIGSVALTAAWRQYVIELRGTDLSSVIGGFAWVATAASNPGGLTFYLDDIRYEAGNSPAANKK